MYCNKVPDSSYVFPLSSADAVFSGNNDRIVSTESQKAFSQYYYGISEVDHMTVLKDSSTAKKVHEILDKP